MHPFSTHENMRKPYGFLMFKGGREKVHCEQMGSGVFCKNIIFLLTYYDGQYLSEIWRSLLTFKTGKNMVKWFFLKNSAMKRAKCFDHKGEM